MILFMVRIFVFFLLVFVSLFCCLLFWCLCVNCFYFIYVECVEYLSSVFVTVAGTKDLCVITKRGVTVDSFSICGFTSTRSIWERSQPSH